MTGEIVPTAVLLWSGIVAVALWLGVLAVDGARRPGYDPAYHTGSELMLGPGGWLPRLVFLLAGVGLGAYAVGVQRLMGSPVPAALIGVSALGFVVSGTFVPDPVRGYPPGAPAVSSPTRAARVHDLAGPTMFLALFGACLALAVELDGVWAAYSLATAVVGLGLTVLTARAYLRDAPTTGLVQRALVATYGVWVVLVGAHLAGS